MKKYRPSLSLVEIDYILTNLARDANDITGAEIINNLSLFRYKISHELVTASYVVSKRAAPADSFISSSEISPEEHKFVNNLMTVEEKKEYLDKLLSPSTPH